MTAAVDTSLPWTEHFIKYGYAVLRQQVSREFCDKALGVIRAKYVEGPGKGLPFDEWTTQNVKHKPAVAGDPFLDTIYDQPNIRRIITTMFGTDEAGVPTGWSGKRDYQLFLTPFSPGQEPVPLKGGHIDFGGNVIPIFGNAFVIQVCLRDTEPHGGNITIIPGSHKLVQERAIKDPMTQYPYDFDDYPYAEPYEHVARAGDVVLMHHLSFHSGNPAVGATRRPRIALHLQAHRTTFLTKADPAADNPPWVKSFTLNGFYEDPHDEQRYIRFNEAKKALWGEWHSDDGQAVVKIFTWIDGQLHARVSFDGGPEFFTVKQRFDGKRLNFELPVDAAAAARLGLPEGEAGSGEMTTAATATESLLCRAVAAVDPVSPERMAVTLTPVAEGETVELSLQRVKTYSGRVLD